MLHTKPQKNKAKIKNTESVDFITADYKNPDLTIEIIAKQSCVSEVHFIKIFKSEYGISPLKYIIKLRMNTVMRLIADGYYTLFEVAYVSGYNDYRHFSAEFKQINGLSPSEYKKTEF